MTDQELATQIFPASRSTSISSASVITAVAASDSSDGSVSVTIDGAQVGGANTKIVVPTTLSVASGETVLLTLYGEDGHGKKAFVSGKVGESGGGGDPSLPGRVSTLESEMDAVQSDVAAEKSKINELVEVLNRRGFIRLYNWTSSTSRGGCWYNPLTGMVVCPAYVNGTPGTGWHDIGSGIPSALSPGSLRSTPYPNQIRVATSNTTFFYVTESGHLGFYTSYGGAIGEQTFLVYLVNADLNYTSTVSTVSSSISPLTVTRAYAARVALGDGLDVTSDEFEKTAAIYDDAYDVIFGADTYEER